MFFEYGKQRWYLRHNWPSLQRGLSAIAELLLFSNVRQFAALFHDLVTIAKFFLGLISVYVVCRDVDECVEHVYDECHTNADCFNNFGSYCCVCQRGYYGDGNNCTGTIDLCIAKRTAGCVWTPLRRHLAATSRAGKNLGFLEKVFRF